MEKILKKVPDYSRIISTRHFDRINRLISPDKVIYGGKTDRDDKFISPTLLEGVTIDDAVMQEEIFGPVLPIITYDSLDEAIQYIKQFEKPLALYIFSENNLVQERVLNELPCGGGCVNETVMHVGQTRMPFGGVGESGIGAYHGQSSFDTFSHHKSFLKKSTLMDMAIKYPPYKNNLGILKKLISWFN